MAGVAALLTAVHFHYAGFGSCLLASAIGRELPAGFVRRVLFRLATLAMIAGIPLLAAGITWSPKLELAAAVDVALALLLMGVLLLCRIRGASAGVAWLTGVSGLAALVASGLALSFALVGFARLGQVTMERMAYLHGPANAIGFVGLGLLSFRLARPH